MNKAVEMLQAMRASITDPKHWIQGQLAVNALDHYASPLDDDAVAWCALGVYMRHLGTDDVYCTEVPVLNDLALERLKNIFGPKPYIPIGWAPVEMYNDLPETTHDDILTLFDEAIEKAKELP